MREIYQRLESQIRTKGRLLNDEEIFNFYAENVQRKFCKWVPFYDRMRGKDEAYTKTDMSAKSKQFYHRALGQLVASGRLPIVI